MTPTTNHAISDMGVAADVDINLFMTLGLFGLLSFLGIIVAAAAPLV